MISLQRELLFEAIDELSELVKLHYEEVALHKENVPLAPMWERYSHLEAADAFVLYTARMDGKLIGYSAFFINRHMHYGDTVMAHNDVIFMHPDHRRGVAGIKLIKFCEQQLRDSGVVKITWHVKTNKDWKKILERMGYVAEDIIMGKVL
jgi:GNAT superfamily N-acetyltransferase